MKRLILATAFLFICAATAAHADSITYNVSVNTSSQNGNYGYIDLLLNGSGLPGSPDVTATVSGFNGAVLNPGDPLNDNYDTGALPGDVTIANQLGNDYFEGLTFGDTLNFTVTLFGDGVSSSGSLSGDSGTVFQLSLYDSSISSALFSDDGVSSALITINPDGSPTVDASSSTSVTAAAATPEPASLSLLALGGALIGAARRLRQKAA